LALLVFFALFGVFLTQYLPLWMEQNESQLSNQAQASLSTLKSGVDDQYILGGIPSYSVPFTLASQSVPLLAQPTIGTIAYLAGCPDGFYANGTPRQPSFCDFDRLSYTAGKAPTGAPPNQNYSQTATTNYLVLSLPNRYYPTVTYFFESDGLAAAQSSVHQAMLFPPPLNISRSVSGLAVQSSLLVLLGSPSTFSGAGSKAVTSSLVTSTTVSSNGRFLTSTGASRTFTMALTLGVHDICGWYNSLYNTTLTALGPAPSTLKSNPGPGNWTLSGSWASGSSATVAPPPSSAVCASSVTQVYDLTLTLYGVSYAASFVAQVQLAFNQGGL